MWAVDVGALPAVKEGLGTMVKDVGSGRKQFLTFPQTLYIQKKDKNNRKK
jgi:hypothetical protein